MRSFSAAALALVSALASGCTIHVVEQPASPQAWNQPQAAPVAAASPRPVAVARPVEPPPPVLASQVRPSAYGPVTTAPTSKPAPVVQAEPRPSRPVTTKPAREKPTTSKPVVQKPKGRYPFRLTRPEPRRPTEHDAGGTTADDKRVRAPLAATR